MDENFESPIQHTYLNGSLSDNQGNKINFSTVMGDFDEFIADHRSADSKDENNEYGRKNHAYSFEREFKFYLPDLKNIMNSKKKEYTCEFTVIPSTERKSVVEFYFTFKLDSEKIDSVNTSMQYDIDYSYIIGDLRLAFKRLYVGETESNILVELIPRNQLAEQMKDKSAHLYVNTDVYITNGENDAHPVSAAYSDDNDQFIIFQSGHNIAKSNKNRYYTVLSYRGGVKSKPYNKSDVISMLNNPFRIMRIRYDCASENEWISEKIGMSDTLYDGVWDIDCNPLDNIEVSLRDSFNEVTIEKEPDGAHIDYTIPLDNRITIDNFAFHIYELDSSHTVYVDDIKLNDRPFFDEGYSNYEFVDMELILENNNRSIIYLNGFFSEGDDGYGNDMRYGVTAHDEYKFQELPLPDKITVAYVVFDEIKGAKHIRHYYYSPKYYSKKQFNEVINEYGIEPEAQRIEAEQKRELFEQNNSFAVNK